MERMAMVVRNAAEQAIGISWISVSRKIPRKIPDGPHQQSIRVCKILDHTLGYLKALERLVKYHQVYLIVIGKIC
jgi:hypothetical protein